MRSCVRSTFEASVYHPAQPGKVFFFFSLVYVVRLPFIFANWLFKNNSNVNVNGLKYAEEVEEEVSLRSDGKTFYPPAKALPQVLTYERGDHDSALSVRLGMPRLRLGPWPGAVACFLHCSCFSPREARASTGAGPVDVPTFLPPHGPETPKQQS